jgi:phosphoglycolate phosphatase
LFGSVVGAGDAAADKPDSAPVALALQSSGVAAGREVWLVGDTEVDIQCASNSGCIPILLGAGLSERELESCAPHRVCAGVEALYRLFEAL